MKLNWHWKLKFTFYAVKINLNKILMKPYILKLLCKNLNALECNSLIIMLVNRRSNVINSA